MAQTGFTPILIYSSSTPSQAPAVANLTNSTLGSELAINITDGKLFYKDNANAIQVIGWKTVPTTAGGTGLTSYSQGDLLYYNSGTTLTALAKNTTATRYLSNTGTNNNPAWAQINLANGVTGTLPTGNGGTNLTSFTANGIVYASSTSALTTGSALTFDGTSLSIGGATVSGTIKLGITSALSNYVQVTSTGASTGSGYRTANATNEYLIGAGAVSGGSGLEFRDVTNSATRLILSSAGDLQFFTAGTKLLNSSGRTMLNQTGAILQVVQNTSTGSSSTTSTTFVDVTNFTVTITPSSTSSKILVIASSRLINTLVAATNVQYYQALLRGSTSLLERYMGAESAGGGLQALDSMSVCYLDSPSTTSATTYKIQHRVSIGTSTGSCSEGYIIALEISG